MVKRKSELFPCKVHSLKSNAVNTSVGNAVKAKKDSGERPLNKTCVLGFGEGFWKTASAPDMASRGLRGHSIAEKWERKWQGKQFCQDAV